MKLPKIVGLTPEQKKELQKIFKCSHAVVSYALNGTRANETSIKIRTLAKKKFGAIEFTPTMEKVKVLK